MKKQRLPCHGFRRAFERRPREFVIAASEPGWVSSAQRCVLVSDSPGQSAEASSVHGPGAWSGDPFWEADVMQRRTAALLTAMLVGVTVTVTATGGTTIAAEGAAPSLPPHDEHEPADTRIAQVDGTGVVFQYGEVVPSFDGWAHHEPIREYRSLDGDRRFRFDPNDEGLAKGWQEPDADLSGWDTIAVPSSGDLKHNPTPWGSYDGSNFGTGTAFYDGYAWYRTTTHVPGTSFTSPRSRISPVPSSPACRVRIATHLAPRHL